MDISELERLVQYVRNAPIRDLTLRQGEGRITIRKSAYGSSVGSQALTVQSYAPDSGSSEFGFGDDRDENQTEHEYEAVAQDQTLGVTAPLVGIFHHIKPIVGLGATVVEGQVVGVIEAMKLITEVTTPGAGVVVDILIEDGLPVEYGQQLFTLQSEGDVSML